MTNSGASSHEQNVAPASDGFGAFEYVFPAIRGTQAGREFFVSMCPLRLIPKVFLFDEDELVPEMRAQRTLNRARLPELARYIIDNPTSYVFSALTASVDADVRFEAPEQAIHGDRVGLLRVPMSARFVINDGQHRRAAIELALKERPELADESIAIVFFLDAGLKRSQQMFADLNRHAVRPSPSIGILYDHRDDGAAVVRQMVLASKTFRGIVELEGASLAPRSRKLFTLSGLFNGTRPLLRGRRLSQTDAVVAATTFWEGCVDVLGDWRAVVNREMTAGELRRDYIHGHGVALQALGMVGAILWSEDTNDDLARATKRLAPLSDIDWARSNTELWGGRVLNSGRISRSSASVILTANVLLRRIGVELPPEHRSAEDAYEQNGKVTE